MADDARQVAFDPRAPADEQADAQAQLSETYKPTAGSLLAADSTRALIEHIQGEMASGSMMKGNLIPFPGRYREPPDRGMQSVDLDDFQISVTGNYFERPSALGFEALRSMVEQTPVLSAVVLTRIREVQRFCGVSEDGGPGFEIRHVDREHQKSEDEQNAAKLLRGFFANCGWETNPRRRRNLKRDNFASFMAKLTRDTLSYDACPIETEMKRDRKLGMDGFYAVDGSTVRLCTEEGYEGDDEIFALQVVQGRIATTYTRDQLIYEVRNPRADVRVGGYGMSEVELLIRVVTGFLNAMTYNIAGFDQNAIPKGLLQLSGEYDQHELAAFKRMWAMQVKGVQNAWSLPMLVTKDGEGKATFERFGVEFNEMYFSKWMTFLTSIICAVFGMTPDQINFESFSAQKSSLSGSDTAEKLADSKDKGLRPLLSFMENTLTDYVVSDFSDKFCFRFTGLDERDKQQEWEARKLVLTVDETRADLGLEAHPDPKLGSAPINPALIPAWQAGMQPQQPDQGGEFGGQPGEDYGQEDEGEGGEGEKSDAGDAPPASGGAQPPEAGEEGEETGAGTPEGDFGKAFIYRVEP